MSSIQYVTVAQALASHSSGLYVQDTAANIAAALPALETSGRIANFTFVAAGTVTVAQLALLAALPNLYTGGFQLTVADAGFNLLPAPARLFTTQFSEASAPSTAKETLVAHTSLTGNPTLNAAQLAQLEGLPGFSFAASDHVTVADSLANIAADIGTHPAWFSGVDTVTVRLDGTHIGAFAAAQFGLLSAAGKSVTFTASGANTTLAVTAAASSIAANAAGLADLAGHVTVTYSLASPVTPVTAAQGAVLAGLAGFNIAAQALQVADTGAAIAADAASLFGHGFSAITVSSGNFTGTAAELADATLHFAAGATASLSASATVTAAAANTLSALPGFTTGTGATLTVQDNVANLLSLTAAAQSDAGVVELSGSQTVTIAQLEALAAFSAKFHEAGFALTVQGSAAALEAVPNLTLALAAHVVVDDTAANIVAAIAHNWGSVAPAYELSAGGAISGAQATALAGLGAALSLNGQTLTVQDNAAGVVGAAAAIVALGIQASVTDTVAGVAASEAALAQLGSALSAVTISDSSIISAQAASAIAPLAAKLTPASAFTVSDGAANVTTYLSSLEAIAGKLGANLVLDVSGTASQLAADVAGFAGTGATLNLTVSGGGTVTAQQAAALVGHLGNTTLNISDTGADVAQYAAALAAGGSQIGALTLTDVGSGYTAAVAAGIAASTLDTKLAGGVRISVNDNAANIGANAAGLEKLATDGKLAGVSDSLDNAAAVAANIAALNAVQAHVTVQDTTANVQAHLDALGLVQGLSRVTLTDAGGNQIPNLAFTVAQLTSDSLVTAGVLATNPAAKFNVVDTAANIAADLVSANSVLVSDHTELHSVTSSNGPISLTLAQEQALAGGGFNPLTGFSADIPFNLTGVSLANLSTAAGLNPVSIAIADTAENLTANLAGGNAITTGNTLADVDGITVTDGGSVTLTVAQLGSLALLFTHTPTLIVSDTASDISLGLAAHQALINELIADPTSIASISITGGNAVTLTALEAQQLANAHLLNTFASLLPAGSTLTVAASVADLAAVAVIPVGQLSHVTIAVTDTAANLTADLLSGNSLLQHYSETVTSVTLAVDPATPAPNLSAAGITALYTYGFINPGNAVPLPVSDTLANILAAPPAALETADTTVTIADSAANLSADLAVPTTASALENLSTALTTHLSIALTDAAPVVNVNDAIYSAAAGLLSKITYQNPVTGRGPVVVTDTAAALDANHAALAAATAVSKVVVVDTAADVLTGNYLTDLQTLGSRLWITLTDAQLSAFALTAQMLQTAHLSTTGSGVFDTAQNIAGLAGAGQAAVSFLNTYGATVTSVTGGYVNVAQLEALENLTDLHLNGQTFVVYDSAGDLTGVGAAAVLNNALVSGVYLNASALGIGAAEAVALFAIPKFHATDLSGNARTVSVTDTASAIDAVHTQLAALGTDISAVQVATGGGAVVVSAATFADLLALQATLTGGGTMTVSDTPANIANALTALPAVPSIAPSSWALTATGTVTEAQAVALGIAAGENALTVPNNVAIIVTLSADTTITAAQASDLGNLVTAGAAIDWVLNGHHLIVSDTAANLAALSANAKADVLPSASVVVNDTTSITAAQAEALVALLKNNNLAPNATGTITASQLSFAHAENVVGHVADLQTLETALQALTGVAGTGWTGVTSLQSAFALTAADTVANLVSLTSANNAAFLASLQGTTVYSGQTISATVAETLATIASQIHFSLGSNTLTVQDGPAALLAGVNQAGVALATAVELTGAVQVNAATALSLLGLQNLVLTGTPLTVSDTTQNLLNASLDTLLENSAYANDITVSPTDLPVVTVQQAETLAEIGFTGSLTIADSTADLLSAANEAVVAAAAHVTLAGNETVSAGTAAAIAELPNFDLNAPGGILTLAASATVNAVTLVAIASLGNSFNAGGNTLTLAANSGSVTLTAGEFETLQNAGAVLNGTGNTITVADSVAHLQSLVANPAWTELSGTLQAAYHLVAVDTISALAGIGNTLTGLYGVQLSQNATLGAAVGADETTLGNLEAVVTATGHPLTFAPGVTLTISGTASAIHNLAAPETALATTIEVDQADAHTFFLGGAFTVNANQTLLVSDTVADLTSAQFGTDLANNPSVHVQAVLSGNDSVGASLGTLLSLPGFSTGGHTLTLTAPASVTGAELQQIADMGAHFVAGNNAITVTTPVTLSAAEITALAGDTVAFSGTGAISVTDTAAALAALAAVNNLPPFTTLSVSAAGSITAANLTSLAMLAANHTITDNGHAITLSDSNVLSLTPTQYTNLYDNGNGILSNLTTSGHVVSAALASPTATDTDSIMSFSATGVPNATVKLYNEQGTLLSSSHEGQSSFTITASDPADHNGNGQAFAFTEVVNGVESAPVVVLDQGVIQAAITAAGAVYSGNNADVQIGNNENLHLYTAGDPNLQTLGNTAALVYDPHAHTVSLDLPNAAPVVLITLGSATDPASLSASEVLIKHHA